MNQYLQHQLDIEICATEVMSDVVEKCPEPKRTGLLATRHLIRSTAKRWLNALPETLRSGENTVASSAALSRVRISCLKSAVKMASSDLDISGIVDLANSQFLRDYLPMMQKLHSAKSLFDTPVILLADAQQAFQGSAPPKINKDPLLPHHLFTVAQAKYIMNGIVESDEDIETARNIAEKFTLSTGPHGQPLTEDEIRYLDDKYRANKLPDDVGAGTAMIAAMDLIQYSSPVSL